MLSVSSGDSSTPLLSLHMRLLVVILMVMTGLSLVSKDTEAFDDEYGLEAISCLVWIFWWTLSPPLRKWQVTVWSWYFSCFLCFSFTLWWIEGLRFSLEQKCLPKSISAGDTPVVVWGVMWYWERKWARQNGEIPLQQTGCILSDIYSGFRNSRPIANSLRRCCIVSSAVAVVGMTFTWSGLKLWQGLFLPYHGASKINVKSCPGDESDFGHSYGTVQALCKNKAVLWPASAMILTLYPLGYPCQLWTLIEFQIRQSCSNNLAQTL